MRWERATEAIQRCPRGAGRRDGKGMGLVAVSLVAVGLALCVGCSAAAAPPRGPSAHRASGPVRGVETPPVPAAALVVAPPAHCTKPAQRHPFAATAPHPRIWLTAARLRRLGAMRRAKSAEWQALEATASRADNQLPQATASALIYAVTKEPRWAQRAKMIVLAFARKHQSLFAKGLKDQYRGLGQTLPLVYDWVHDQLSLTDKRVLLATMARGADYDVEHRQGIGTDSDAVLGGAKTTLLIGLACAGDHPKAAAYRRSALFRWERGVKDWLGFPRPIKSFIRESSGGIWPEGNKYNPDTLSYLFQFVEAERGVSGRDLLCEVELETGRNFAADLILATLHTMFPGYEDGFTYADAESPDWPVQLDRWGYALVHAADRIPHSVHARWAQHFIKRVRGRHGGLGTFLSAFAGQYNGAIDALPFYRPALKEQEPQSLPLTHIAPAPGPGFVYARTSNAPDASGVLLQGGSIVRVDHVHFDSGSFQLYRKGEWLSREVRGYGLWATVSAAHNTIVLRGYGPQENIGFEWGRAKLLSSCARRNFVYAASDLSAAYNIDPVRNKAQPTIKDAGRDVTRQWVFLRPQGWLVVFDRIETFAATQSKELIFQTMSEPKIVGNRIYARSLKGVNPLGAARQVWGDQGLAITSVYPRRGLRYTKRDGRRYYATPRPELHMAYPAPKWEIHPSERRWHVVLRLPDGLKRAYALNVLVGFDRGQRPPEVSAVVSPVGTHGARIGSGVQQIELRFFDRGRLGGELVIGGRRQPLGGCS